MSKILFIGGGGFIGSNLVRFLDRKKYEIHIIEPEGANVSRLDGTETTIHYCAIGDTKKIGDIISANGIGTIVHLVSTLIPGSSYEDYRNEFQNVIFPSIELMEMCADRNIKFVYFSSGGTVYGNRKSVLPFVETDCMSPVSYYGWSKQMMENSVLFMHRTKNLKYLILRPSNPYGHGQNLYGRQGVVAVAIGRLLKGEPVEVWGDGSVVRDYIYIDDLAKIFVALLEGDVCNDIVNIGSGRGYSVNDVLAFLKIISKSDFGIHYKDARPVDVSNVVLDITKMRKYVDIALLPMLDGMLTFYEESIKQ